MNASQTEERTPPARRRALAAALLLALLQAALLLHTAWDKSDTADEPHYLAVAVRQWQGDLYANCESPALPKWGFGLALRLADGALFDPAARIGRDPLWSRPLAQTRRNLLAARATTVLVTVCAGFALFLAGARFGWATGLFAQALWACSPSVLAAGSLATLDAWAASAAALVLLLGVRLVERPGPGRAAALGAALALAAACKVTALGLLPVAALVTLFALRGSGARRSALALGTLGLALVATLAAVYGFAVAPVDTARLCGKTVPGVAGRSLGVWPFAPWIEGLLQQLRHGEAGHRGYLFGEVRFTGWWWFYLASLALKTTLGAQALALVRLLAWTRARPARGSLLVDAALLAYPLLLLLVMSAGRAQNGLKYLLPAFPLALLWLARAAQDVPRAFPRGGRALVAALAGLAALESLRVHPHHLMFFNLWAGGPERGPRYLVVGDDWGQDQRRLAEWQRATRPWRLYYTRYSGNPHHWGVSYEPPPCEPHIGFFALHAVEVHRPKRVRPGCLDWLTVEAPDARLGYSIYLYQVNKARIERLVAQRGRGAPFWRTPPSARGPAPSEDAGDEESGA